MKRTMSAARVATGGFDFFRFFTSTLNHKGSLIITVAEPFVRSPPRRSGGRT